jgi:hypothetical protein
MEIIKRLLGRMLDAGRRDQLIRQVTLDALDEQGISWNSGEKDYRKAIWALHSWFVERCEYRHDPAGVEYVTHPRRLFKDYLKTGRFVEDCDGLSLGLAAAASSCGFPSAVALVDTDKSGTLSHAMTAIKAPMRKAYRIPNPNLPGAPPRTWHADKEYLLCEVTKGAVRGGALAYSPGWRPPGCTVVVLCGPLDS